MIKSKLFLACLVASVPLVGCGVRGKPQPPLTPPELGRGQPTFKRATEDYAFPTVPGVQTTPAPTPRKSQSKDSQ